MPADQHMLERPATYLHCRIMMLTANCCVTLRSCWGTEAQREMYVVMLCSVWRWFYLVFFLPPNQSFFVLSMIVTCSHRALAPMTFSCWSAVKQPAAYLLITEIWTALIFTLIQELHLAFQCVIPGIYENMPKRFQVFLMPFTNGSGKRSACRVILANILEISCESIVMD